MDPKTKYAKKHAKKEKVGTALTFTAEELADLARYVVAGMVLLQTKPPVAARIKSGLSRLGANIPAGL